MSTELSDYAAELQLVDHHVHTPLSHSVGYFELEQMLTESDRPAAHGTSFFDSQVGFALRRHCAPLLGLEAGVSASEYFSRRQDFSSDELAKLFLSAARTSDWMVDTGFGGDQIWSLEEFDQKIPGQPHEIVRLETLLEDVARISKATELPERFEAAVQKTATSAAGWKSVVAYRFGFDFTPVRPTPDEVRAAASSWLADIERGGPVRLTDPVLLRFALYTASDTGKPIQLHVGFGDPDIELHRCDPALLTDWIRDVEPSGSPILLLHCYPFHRNAGYLAHSFPQVYCDVGLSINYTGAASPRVIAESMELAPFGKILYSSDAWGLPELHYLGSVLWRQGTAEVLSDWVSRGEWTLGDAQRVLNLIGRENALRVYGIAS